MITLLKRVARAVAPAPVKSTWGRYAGAVKTARARQAYGAPGASGANAFLPASELDRLMRHGYVPPDHVRYDAGGLVDRAHAKIAMLEQCLDLHPVETSLELGCWDGMVAAALRGRGIGAIGLDIVTRGLDPRARPAGARFVRADAEAIAVRSESIDLVYSFASLEHFPHPDRALREIGRVLRPGGHAYLSFGPLYFSPYGRHAYRQIPVPFCHLLFAEADLHAFAVARGLQHDWPFVNGWALARYRQLWAAVRETFEVRSYVEHGTGGVGTELIARYPECFRPHDLDFDEFLVTIVDIVLRKQAHA